MMNFKTKNWFTWVCLTVLCSVVLSCKPKVSDADIKARVEQETANNPNVLVAVKKGEVTLSGIVTTEEERRKLTEAVKNADPQNIKSVVDDLTVATIPEEISSTDQELQAGVEKVADAYPMVQVRVKDGVVHVSGDIAQNEVQSLKMGIDELNPKKVDMSLLTVK